LWAEGERFSRPLSFPPAHAKLLLIERERERMRAAKISMSNFNLVVFFFFTHTKTEHWQYGNISRSLSLSFWPAILPLALSCINKYFE